VADQRGRAAAVPPFCGGETAPARRQVMRQPALEKLLKGSAASPQACATRRTLIKSIAVET